MFFLQTDILFSLQICFTNLESSTKLCAGFHKEGIVFGFTLESYTMEISSI